MKKDKILIIGAGPAGLVAGYELQKLGYKTEIYEKSSQIGGLAKTVKLNNTLMDIGPHRFFSKEDKIMKWWTDFLPIFSKDGNVEITYQNTTRATDRDFMTEEQKEDVMLLVDRQTRIFYDGNFFDYPIKLSFETLQKIGFARTVKIGITYVQARVFPREEITLEDFFINKFGKTLYEMFFETYTEKVWGVSPRNINADWGAQRVKGVSVSAVIMNAIKKALEGKGDLQKQKDGETSLIEKFLYPRYGAGHMWETVAKEYEKIGGKIHLNSEVVSIGLDKSGKKVKKVDIQSNEKSSKIECDLVISTMPVPQLLNSMAPKPPENVLNVANDLKFRNLIIVGLVLNNLLEENGTSEKLIKDNWIYIHDKNVQVGRMQIINNLSKDMLEKENHVAIGLEYFCNEEDEVWNTDNKELIETGIKESVELGLIKEEDVVEAHIIRAQKAYPSYIDSYKDFDLIKNYFNTFENLYLIGRNGMHRYNNMDHSMLAAFEAVENIKNNKSMNDTVWEVNTEKEYHEVKKS